MDNIITTNVKNNLSYTLKRVLSDFKWTLDPVRWKSNQKIKELKNIHAGERCFIIGNGPSLNKMDLDPLKDEITFGLNRIYLLFDTIRFSTTYYVSVNKLLIEQCHNEIEELPMLKFISRRAKGYINNTDDVIFLNTLYPKSFSFTKDLTQKVHEGATVTYVAMQIAYYLGFDEVILIGVDHNFVTKGDPHKEVITEKYDLNHFNPSYFGKGFKWNLPDLETSEKAYKLAKKYFEYDGRKIFDATVGGKLNVFEKIDYTSIFK